MAEQSNTPPGPDGGPARRPTVLPWLVMYTVGRIGIFAALTMILWLVGLDFWSGCSSVCCCRCRRPTSCSGPPASG